MVNKALEQGLVAVTGAGSGIGRATALAFAAQGARVLAVDIDGPAAERTAIACGPPASARECDVADWEAVESLAREVHAEHGPLDVLVNNAGVGMTGRWADTSIEDWRWIRSINIDGVVHGCQAFGPAMLARGSGHIVNLSSGLGYTPRATEPAYVTTKAAVLALSQCLRADWAGHGVGVSVICPGVVNTPIVSACRFLGAQAEPSVKARAERIFRRGHRPEAVAEAIVDAVRRNRALVPVGWEARLGWWGHRLSPVALQLRLARWSVM